MKTISSSQPLRRLVLAITAIVALPMIALVHTYVASLVHTYVASVMLTYEAVEPDESTGQATTIDVTDIDKNGTVMYTVSPPEGPRSDSNTDFTVPPEVLKDADLIRITVSDVDDSLGVFESKTQGDCSFTLHLHDDDRYDTKTGTYTGYIRLTDEETARSAGSDVEHQENCGLYITYSD